MRILGTIAREMKAHSPFTLLGAVAGVVLMTVFRGMTHEAAEKIFYVFHPLHVMLSAVVITTLYCRYRLPESVRGLGFFKVLAVGCAGSVAIGTLSDSVIPLWGEKLLKLPHPEAHIGCVEAWWLVNPMAAAGVLIGYFVKTTKLPHAGHILISTWASLFHMIMALGAMAAVPYFGIFVFLFLAVWLPCCFSDIVFPLLFSGGKALPEECSCPCHKPAGGR